jgi:hypothetical protein
VLEPREAVSGEPTAEIGWEPPPLAWLALKRAATVHQREPPVEAVASVADVTSVA